MHVNSSIQTFLYYYASIYTSEQNFSLCITLYGRSLALIIMDAHQPAIRQSHAVILISAADNTMHRANCDKSMKFGILRQFATLKKMRVGPILKIASIPYF